MASVMDREVVRVDRIWREEGQDPWLVSFYVTEIKGRMECVGFGLRSFLALKETPDSEHPLPTWTWCPLPIADLETPPTSDEGRDLYDRLEDNDDEWPARIIYAERQLGKPMPLSATRVRALPFGHLLALATRDRATWTRWLADAVKEAQTDSRSEWAAEARQRPYRASEIELGLAQRALQASAVESLQGGHPRARDESAVTLQRVANLYEHFYREGSSSPTRDVAEALNMSRSTVAKRIMRCRKTGLLASTSRGKAGGMPDQKGAKP